MPISAQAETEYEFREGQAKFMAVWLYGGLYTALDAEHIRYRDEQTRSPSGIWMLDQYHGSLSRAMGRISGEGVTEETKVRIIGDMLNEWLASQPKSNAAKLTYARFLLWQAARYRGTEYASKVPEEAWEPYRKFQAQAEAYLIEHKDELGNEPEWYSMMMEIANGQSWAKPRFGKLFDEAVSKWPEYHRLYFNAVDYYMPRYHGSAAEIEAVARKAVALTQEKLGIEMYARIYWYAAEVEYYNYNLMQDSKVQWPKMKQGFEDMMKRYPDAWNLNAYARYACEAGDKEKTAELMAKIGDNPDMHIWWHEVAFQKCQKLEPINSILKFEDGKWSPGNER